jgi:signal transduction histidine kinase
MGGRIVGEIVGVTRPDGEVAWLSVNAEPILVGGEPESIIVTFTDVTHVKRQEEALRESLARQRELTQRVTEAQEQERTRIARELHDELGQAMTILRMQVGALKPSLDASASEQLGEALQHIDETAELVRRLSHELRPGILDVFGLAAALEWQTERFDSPSLRARFDDETEDAAADLPKPLATALFRIYQEALTNCARHSGASAVTCTLANEGGGALVMTVRDNGRGLSRTSEAGALGFLNMRERVFPWDGTVEIDGPEGEGVTITVTIPERT